MDERFETTDRFDISSWSIGVLTTPTVELVEIRNNPIHDFLVLLARPCVIVIGETIDATPLRAIIRTKDSHDLKVVKDERLNIA